MIKGHLVNLRKVEPQFWSHHCLLKINVGIFKTIFIVIIILIEIFKTILIAIIIEPMPT